MHTINIRQTNSTVPVGTLSSPSATPSNEAINSSSTLPASAIAGIVVGTLLLMTVVGVIAFFVFRSRRTEQKEQKALQQKVTVEEFVAVSRSAAASRSVSRCASTENLIPDADVETGVARSSTFLAVGGGVTMWERPPSVQIDTGASLGTAI